MPNKIKRNKRDKTRVRTGRLTGDSVKDLLARTNPARVSGIVEKHDTLVIFTASAAWSARVRFALAEIEEALKRAHPGIAHIAVRVLPG
jgi:hypothetical protein